MLMPGIYRKNLFGDFFDDFFSFPAFENKETEKAGKNFAKAFNAMKTDIKEKKDSYELEIDLPGFSKDDVKISLNDGYLTIQASKDTEVSSDKDENEKENGHYIRRERYIGSCSRSFYVGDAICEDDIKAAFKHGTLKLSVRKVDAPAAIEKKYIQIEG